jgi:CHAD domain-containing protein
MRSETVKKTTSLAPVRPIPHFSSFARNLEQRLIELRKVIRSLPKQDSRRVIHDLRVFSRRARACCSIVSPCLSAKKREKMKEALHRLTSLLGPVRSLDVGYSDLKKRLKFSNASSPVFRFLLKKIKKERKNARKKLVEAFKKHHLERKFKKTSRLHVKKDPSTESFMKVIFEKTESSGENLLDSWKSFSKKGTLEDLHQVRIDLKKWRYLLEIQAEYTGAPTPLHLEKIKSVQDRLGKIHDVEVLREMLKGAKIPNKYRKSKPPLRQMKRDLKKELKLGLASFHREGEKVLIDLFTERKTT